MLLKITGKRLETDQIFSLILAKPENFNFYPGQYLDVELPVKDRRGNTRTFTISSSPTEDFLMITTKKGVSKFKKAMEKLKGGDVINTTHPIGTFTLDESSPAVFIAGGIGITPFRSIIKHTLDHKLNTPITLFYLNSTSDFLFKTELDKWQKNYSKLRVAYINTSKDSRLNTPNTKYLIPNTIYYLAGPPKMVDDFGSWLIGSGVDETNIRYDRFDGY